MAIQTHHSGLVHFAAQKSGKFVIFITDLAVGIIQIAVVHDSKIIMVRNMNRPV